MKYTNSLSVVILASCLFLVNCKEKENIIPTTPTTTPSGNNYYFIDEIFEELKSRPKTITIDAGKDASFYGNSGTRYMLQANSLTTMDGTGVTGDVQIEVTEYLDRGDMIFSKMLPISNGSVLESGGELSINARQSGKPLRLAPGSTIQANVPQKGTPDPEMVYFRGEVKQGDEVNLVNWQTPPVDTVGQWAKFSNKVAVVDGDTTAIISDTLGMINIDKFMKLNSNIYKVDFVIDGVTVTEYDAVCTYALFKNFNALMSVGITRENNFYYSLPDMPTDLVAFTVKDGKFYGGIVSFTAAKDAKHTIKLTQADPVKFKQQVSAL